MHVSEQTLTPSYVVRYWSLSSRPAPPPFVFTLTIRVAHYVYKLDDGSEQVVDKHDVVFDFNISGMSWVSFNEAVAQHIKMGIGQEVRLFALDTVESTVDLVLNGQQLNMHFIGNHWDFEAKKSFLLAEVVTLEAPNAKKVGKKKAPKKPTAPKNPVKPPTPKKPAAPRKPSAPRKPQNPPAPKKPSAASKKAATNTSVECSASSSMVVDNSNLSAFELAQTMGSRYRVFRDDMEFSPDDVDHPATMQSQIVFYVVDSTERCESTVVNQEDPLIDWSLIEIAPPICDDNMCDPLGINDVDIPITEENMCDILGINDEAVPEPPPSPPSEEVYMTDEQDRQLFIDAAIPVDNSVPPEEEIAYDKENP